MREIVLIIHNVRSSHNAGSLLRTADGLGVNKVLFSGYTPHPKQASDHRLPHIADKVNREIQKTSLGAEKYISWSKIDSLPESINKLANQGFLIAALEQTNSAIQLNKWVVPEKVALVVGNEVDGIDKEILSAVETHVQIPMLGKKESFNVSVAGAIALYHMRYS